MKGSTKITYKGVAIEVDYDFTPGRPGVWTLPNGDPGYPDEPDELDVESVKVKDVDIYELLHSDIIEEIENLVYKSLN